MKLIAEIDREKLTLDVRQDTVRVSATIDSRSYHIEVREPEAGTYLFIADGRVFECRVDKSGATRGTYQVHVGGDTYNVTLSDPKRLRDAKGSGADADGRASVVAPMPGKVVRVLVEQGAEVAAGDGLAIVEAMKMQNEMKSPKAGTVVEIHALAGATVNAGEMLIVVE
ncbi:MAG TPA: biotin/lipoyl-containing protein [Pyrinomonadaceae bacterium]|nr:biotin/lipoyl-containing protein [Pyrinomonadaceae bacterium]